MSISPISPISHIPKLERQITINKWENATKFLTEMNDTYAVLIVTVYYGENGENTYFILRKNKDTFSKEILDYEPVHSYSIHDYKKWAEL